MPWIFILLPWLELWTLIELGSEIGGFATLLYVAGTLFLGLGLLRRKGLSMLRQMQTQYGGRVLGPQLLLDDAAVLGSGLLLMIPGVITDILALLLMVGPLRRGLARLIGGSNGEQEGLQDHPQDRTQNRAFEARQPRDPGQQQTLEGEFRRLDD
ncbi:FxsA family protein [Halieaceae bacterium IMCC14734]|uniref:FxsA family protein n=1 Tax=Candidatus Litorirhabdus singularis TaxID=2518993 RepID=A0ABT3TMF7_9GAMM|nr:FxsA family protein [Candidatus Litorirhabdus singularis]MCX2983224.1 FxsA family protein [Candidatus Litorirhabdus singularis]